MTNLNVKNKWFDELLHCCTKGYDMDVKKHICTTLHRKMDEAMGHLSFFLWKKVVGTYTNTSH